jgi:hypothetical protein
MWGVYVWDEGRTVLVGVYRSLLSAMGDASRWLDTADWYVRPVTRADVHRL